VKEAALAGKLRLHGWVYQFETGQVMAYNARTERFISLADSPDEKLLIPVAGEASKPSPAEAHEKSDSWWSRLRKRFWPTRR